MLAAVVWPPWTSPLVWTLFTLGPSWLAAHVAALALRARLARLVTTSQPVVRPSRAAALHAYLNAPKWSNSSLVHDSERGPLVKQAFEALASGRFTKQDVIRRATADGLRTLRDRPLSPQTFGNMLRNRIYIGQVESPRQRNHHDFPLRGFVRCEICERPLTGSWSKGRNGRYAYYHCPRRCRAVT